jgi:hypothetical protein
MSTITATQQTAIAEYLNGRHLGSGIGTAEEPCSIAAINLALSGRLTDDIPDCMSPAVGRWIIRIQDAMPDDLRNSERWRSLLPLAAETGRNHEAERAAALLDWLWGAVLPRLQPLADANGFGAAWTAMHQSRTAAAAREAAREATRGAVARATEVAAWVGRILAVETADAAARAEAEATAWAGAAGATKETAEATAWAARAVEAARTTARATKASSDYWTAVDPCAMLDQLINIGTES